MAKLFPGTLQRRRKGFASGIPEKRGCGSGEERPNLSSGRNSYAGDERQSSYSDREASGIGRACALKF